MPAGKVTSKGCHAFVHSGRSVAGGGQGQRKQPFCGGVSRVPEGSPGPCAVLALNDGCVEDESFFGCAPSASLTPA